MNPPPIPENPPNPPGSGLRLRVTYPDGNETSYPLQYREYRIGSDPSSDIFLDQAGLAATHAFLLIGRDGVFLVNLEEAGSVLIEGIPTERRSQVQVGNRIKIGTLFAELDVIADDQEVSRGASVDGTAGIRKGGWSELMGHLGGYSTLNRLLAAEISPDEANEANQTMIRGRKALRVVVLGLIAIVLGRILLVPAEWFALHEIIDDVLFGISLWAVVVLIRFYHVRFVGRLVMPLFCLEVLQLPPSGHWEDEIWTQLGVIAMIALIFFMIGWALDYGASRKEDNTQVARRKVALSGAGLLYGGLLVAVFAFDRYEAGGISAKQMIFSWFSLASCLALVVVPWISRWFRKFGATPLTGDILTCHLVGERRWLRHMFGRLFALGLGLVPVILFLNGLDLAEKIRWPEDPDVIRSVDEAGNEYVWFWDTRGRFIKGEDLKEANLYGWLPARFSSAEEEKRFFEKIGPLFERVQLDPSDGNAYRELQANLEPFRLTDPSTLGALFWNDSNTTLLLEQNRTRPQRSSPEGVDIYLAQDSIGLLSYNRKKVDLIGKQIDTLNWVSASFGIIGLLVLWRRAGDSATARWIGFWLVGALCANQMFLSELYLQHINYQIWHSALESPASNLLLAFWSGAQGIQRVLVWLNILSVPLCATWVLLCWPPGISASQKVWKPRIMMILKILMVTTVINAIPYMILSILSETLPKGVSSLWGICSANFTVVSLMVGFGCWLRRFTRHRSEAPHGGWLLLITFLLSQFAALSLIGVQIGEEIGTFSLFAKIFASLFLVSALVLIVRTMFLRISAERDIGFVVMTLLLPFLFEVLENLAQDLLRQTPFFSTKGSSILGLIMVVVLLGPIWGIVGRVISSLTVRRFTKVQRVVSDAMLELLDGDGDIDFRERSLKMFSTLGIKDFVFYRRTSGKDFDMTIRGIGGNPIQRVAISRMLRECLGGESSFIDTEGIVFEWKYFFQQFELQRLRNATGCRYFLPINIGRNMLGVLGLPDNEESKQLSRFAVAPKMTEFGLSVFVGGKV